MARNGVVNTQMSAFPTPSVTGAKGVYNNAPGPFSAPRGMGGGTVPVKLMESGPSKGPTPTQTAGAETRAPRPGTVQRKYGKSDC